MFAVSPRTRWLTRRSRHIDYLRASSNAAQPFVFGSVAGIVVTAEVRREASDAGDEDREER